MNEDNKIDDISEISERNTPRKNNEKRTNNFYKKFQLNKIGVKKTIYRSQSVVKEDQNRNKEVNNRRYINNEEEQKNNFNKDQSIIKNSGTFTKIFLKNKDFLIKSLHLLKNKNIKISQNNNIRDSNRDENDDLRRKRNNFKMKRSNSCVDLKPTIRKKISITCLKFAKNVSKDNDGIILLENGFGINNCFLNAIVQVLYHLEEFRYKLMAIKIKKEINDPVFQLYTMFNNYESLAKLNTIEMLNSALLRKALHHKFGTYPKGKFGDPIETILELLELIHKEYFENDEKGKTSDDFCMAQMCPSHSNFLLYLKEIKFCPTCSAVSTQKYDKDCFMFTVASSELLHLIVEEETFSNYKYSLFKKVKYITQNSGQNNKVRLNKCKCKIISTRKRLFLYKKFSPFLIINMTWDSDFPFITDICKIYGLIPIIDKNNYLFELDMENGKRKKEELQSNYYLSSMILFGQRHYTCFFYNREIKMWSFTDDEKKNNFKTYHELIVYLIGRRSFPVGLIYTSVNIFLNEREEKYSLKEEQFMELYKKCLNEELGENEENLKSNKDEKSNNKINRNKEKETKDDNKKKKNDNDDSDISF